MKANDNELTTGPLIDEVAARAYLGGVSRNFLRRREAEGKIRSVRLDGRRLWLIESLRAYLSEKLGGQSGGASIAG